MIAPSSPQNPPSEEARLFASEEDSGARLDRFLADKLPGFSRSRLKALIEQGAVTLQGRTMNDPAYRIKAGEDFALDAPPPSPAEPRGESLPLDIVHEDDALIVIDKQAGLVVHPAAGHETGTLVNALIAHCGSSLSGIGGVRRPGIVHRLDKDTTGLMVIAKTDEAHRGLSAQFADHGRTGPLLRRYRAFAWSAPERGSGTISAPLGRHATNRLKMAVRKDGREAVTHYRVADRFGGEGDAVACEIEAELETGRTHQVRAHFGHVGHPLIGDPLYAAGFRSKLRTLPPEIAEAIAGFSRQALHAEALGFEHPSSGEYLEFESDLPEDMTELKRILTEL
jgi:23S rRNA pseudouridine1911/1915/1917 synthase